MAVPADPPGETIAVGAARIRAADVQLIVAETGLSFSGGEMLIWKRNVVIAQGRRFVSHGTPESNALSFQHWLEICPTAVAIHPDGSVRLPHIELADDQDPLKILCASLAIVRKELGRQIVRAFGIALFLAFAAIGLVIFVVAYNVANPGAEGLYKLVVTGIVLAAAACLLFVRGGMLLARRSRIIQILRDLMSKGSIRTDLLTKTLAPSSIPIGSAQAPSAKAPPVDVIPAVLAILSTCLMICPFVGFGLSVIAFAITFRKRDWTRVLAIIALVVSSLSTAFTLIMIGLGK